VRLPKAIIVSMGLNADAPVIVNDDDS
jgi:hypothetical protein